MSDVNELIERISRTRGRVIPAYQYLADHVPDFLVTFNDLIGSAVLYEPDDNAALPVMYRELIVATMATLRGTPEEAIAEHLRRAMEYGLTEQQAIEGFEAAVVIGGGPSLTTGIRSLILATRILAERSSQSTVVEIEGN